MSLSEMVVYYSAMKLTAGELRGEAIVFVTPQTLTSNKPVVYAQQNSRKNYRADKKLGGVLEVVQPLHKPSALQKVQPRRRKSVSGNQKRAHPGAGAAPLLGRLRHDHPHKGALAHFHRAVHPLSERVERRRAAHHGNPMAQALHLLPVVSWLVGGQTKGAGRPVALGVLRRREKINQPGLRAVRMLRAAAVGVKWNSTNPASRKYSSISAVE